MGNCLALVMMKCTLIDACGYLWLDDRVTWICIQLHDMHVDLSSFDVVGLVMYSLWLNKYALLIWYSLVECA